MIQLETTAFINYAETNAVPGDSWIVQSVRSVLESVRDFRDRWDYSSEARQRLQAQNMAAMEAFAGLSIAEQDRRFATSTSDLDLARVDAQAT